MVTISTIFVRSHSLWNLFLFNYEAASSPICIDKLSFKSTGSWYTNPLQNNVFPIFTWTFFNQDDNWSILHALYQSDPCPFVMNTIQFTTLQPSLHQPLSCPLRSGSEHLVSRMKLFFSGASGGSAGAGAGGDRKGKSPKENARRWVKKKYGTFFKLVARPTKAYFQRRRTLHIREQKSAIRTRL